MRKLLTQNPFLTSPPQGPALDENWHTGRWPARWIAHSNAADTPSVVAYKRAFSLDEAATVHIHVSADERYALYLDGVSIGRGSERGDHRHWYFETYDLALAPGDHILVALVWALGDQAPLAQLSVSPGFILACDDPQWIDLLGTGVAPWEAKRMDGLTFFKNFLSFGVGANVEIDGARFSWGYERGDGDGWESPEIGAVGVSAGSYDRHGIRNATQQLTPATLPPMLAESWTQGSVRYVAPTTEDVVASGKTLSLPVRGSDDLADEHAAWEAALHGTGTVTIPPHTQRRIIIDLDDYVCAYTRLITTCGAGATVRVSWAESLYTGPLTEWWHFYTAQKGNRDEIEGKHYCGEGDVFRPDGGARRAFENLWWKAGRYIEVLVSTVNEPLTIEHLSFIETRYPLELEAAFRASDLRFAAVWPLMIRVLQMCSHETYMDCPYYEQLMYVGDTRLEILATYCLTHDDRLPRKAITLFDVSRFPFGLTQSRYPCRDTQIIPPFSLWWCGLLYDFALWRDDVDFVSARMPGLRAVIDAFLSYRNEDGLVEGPPGWNYTDWTTNPNWHRGTPPGAEDGVSGILNWQFALALTYAAELEAWLDEPEAAARMRRYAQEIAQATTNAFWDETRGLFADDLEHMHFSEHAQCLALLTGLVDADKQPRVLDGLFTADDLTRTTIYFSHYLFEVCRMAGRIDKLFERLDEWFELPALGFKTTREKPEPSRSDCHAWGAHPIYHSYASILGIRPGSFGFRDVVIEPQLGPLTSIQATLPHPQGEIVVDLQQTPSGTLSGTITLPSNTSCTLIANGSALPLPAGATTIPSTFH